MGARRRAPLVAATAALLAVSAAPVAAASTASPHTTTANDAAHAAVVRQAPYVKLSHIVDRWVQRNHLAGFTGMAIAPGDGALVVYWKGRAPQALQDLAARSASLPVILRSVPSSLGELDAQERALMRIPGAEEAGVLSDFSGLELTISTTAAAAAAERAAQRANVKLVTHVASSSVQPLANRTADVGPFYGGDEVFHATSSTAGIACSLGFEIAHNGDNTSGMSTANHCGEGLTWDTYAGGTYVGSSVTCSPVTTCQAVDTIPITFGNALPNNDYAPQVWVGAYNSSTATPVIGQGSAIVNQVLCIDGGYTGEVCGNTVQSVNQYVQVSGYATMTGPGFWTVLPTHGNAAGEGDSGSPVIDPTSSGAVGYGTVDVSDLGTAAACTGNPNRTTGCYWRIFSVDLGHMVSGLGAYLVTAPNNRSCSNLEDTAIKDLAVGLVADAAVC